MSSPVHRPRDFDPAALMFAPPWVREKTSKTATKSAPKPAPKSAPKSTPKSAPKSAPKRPRGPPPVESPPTSPDIEDDLPIFIGDRAMLALRRQLSLDPEIVPAPPGVISGAAPLGKIALRLCIVGAIAALGVWAVVSLTSNRSGGGEITQNGSAPAPIAASAPIAPSVRLVHESEATAPLPPSETELPTLPAAFTAHDEPQARPHASAPVSAPAPVRQRVLNPQAAANPSVLSADEIAMLLKRGKADLADGDISAARLLLRRAADAGNAEAALMLGSTFDPLVIAQLGAFGVQADPAKAREWYQKAAALGSNQASEQLAKLTRATE